MANHSRPIILSPDDRRELKRLQQSSSVHSGLSRRAGAVLLIADHISGAEVARRTGYTPVQVSRIRRRFVESGLAGLPDRPRSGRPRRVKPRKTAQVVAMTLKPPPEGVTHWSSRDLARRLSLSHSTVYRIWKAHSLKPHRVETFKFGTDPQVEDKIYDVVGLYLNPPDNGVVLSVDEKAQIQALSRTQPLLPLRPGLPARRSRTHDYRRNGLTSLYAALEVATGTVVGECSARHTGSDFLRFVKRLERRYRKQDLHVIVDNSSTHTTPAVKAWLKKHPRVQFHFTPKGVSWLNIVEAWFSILTRQLVRRGSFDSVRALTQHIRNYINHWNRNPTPFVWTQQPADIVAKAVRRVR